MWEQAFDLLERADRLQRHFFRLGADRSKGPTWEPPIDVMETERRLVIIVALPGIVPDQLEIVVDDSALSVVGERAVHPPVDALIILPTRNLVLFPGLVMPINVGREASVAAVQEAVRSKRRIGIVLQRNAAAENPASTDLHEVGTAAAIVRYLTAPDGTHHLVCQGQQRFRIVKFLDGYPFPVARVELAHETDTITPEIEARMIQVKERAAEALQL